MAVYERYARWARWQGSVEDIVTLAQTAAENASKVAGRPFRATIIQGKSNANREYDSLNEFKDQFVRSEAEGTKTLTVRIGQQTDGDSLAAEAVFSREATEPGARLSVRAADGRAGVDALYSVMEERMAMGRRRLQISTGMASAIGMIVLLVVFVAWNVVLPFINLGNMDRTLILVLFTFGGAVVGGSVVAGTAAMVNWLVPTFELVMDGKTQWEKARTKLLAVAGSAIAIPIVTTLAKSVVGG